LGPEEHHEVYEGECVGMMLALHLLRNEVNPVAVSIWSDSTAAIAASDSARSGPSHYILDIFHSLLTELKSAQPDLRVTISWIPGHLGVEGNERADEEAKRAAQGRSSPRSCLPRQL
ncbi:ribonuclease H-like domain-containing protein, partial [Lentinula edodes]